MMEMKVARVLHRAGTDPIPLPQRIATQIIERANALGLPAGSHLAEQSLADAFRVSRTPTRLALRLLEEMDIVENRPNRGYFLRHAAERLRIPKTIRGESPEDPMYLQIADDRLAGHLPLRFTEAELARRYNLSKARMARILGRMTQEGWLERLPGHGWEFQPMLTSLEAYEQGYRFRMLIEPAALQEPGYRVDEVAFARARAQQEAMLSSTTGRFSSIETFQLGSAFHETIVAASGNSLLLDSIRRVNRLRRLFEYRIHKDRTRLVQECSDHLHILDLIESGRRDEATEFLRRHLDRVLELKLDIAKHVDELAKQAAENTEKLTSFRSRHRRAATKMSHDPARGD